MNRVNAQFLSQLQEFTNNFTGKALQAANAKFSTMETKLEIIRNSFFVLMRKKRNIAAMELSSMGSLPENEEDEVANVESDDLTIDSQLIFE